MRCLRCCLAALLGGLVLSFTASAANVDPGSYGYPISNPFEATITSSPASLQPEVPVSDDIRQDDYELELLPKRIGQVPETFWAVEKLHYRLARQDGPAPLIFIIAGTGARYDDKKPEFLKKLFYGAGYHVVQISSPTNFDFIVSASTSATPGISAEDAEDLYRVMEAISDQQKDLQVTRYDMTGYSLGALDAAFVSMLDESRKRFNFKHVLMINPPVNLYTSVRNLDSLVHVKLPNVDQQHGFLDEVMDRLTLFFNQEGRISLDDAMLFKFQNSKERLSNEEMAMMIGTTFRFASADIIYTSDLLNKRGLITPPDEQVGYSTSLVPYFRKAGDCDFVCYMHQQVLPYWKSRNPDGDLKQLINEASLSSIQDYLKGSSKIAVFHNADDIILGPGDLGFLRRIFGDRLTVYPLGGHCGNINYRVNTDDMLRFFRG